MPLWLLIQSVLHANGAYTFILLVKGQLSVWLRRGSSAGEVSLAKIKVDITSNESLTCFLAVTQNYYGKIRNLFAFSAKADHG